VRFGSRSFPGWTTADYFTFPSLFHLIFFQHAHGKQRVGQKTLQYAQALLIHIQEFYSTSQSAISSQLVSATILLVSSAPVLCRILYQCLPQSSTATLYISHPSGDVMWGLLPSPIFYHPPCLHNLLLSGTLANWYISTDPIKSVIL
jgi:hypothetical protein